MRNHIIIFSISFLMIFGLISCNGDEPEPILTVTMNPDEAGTVVPDGGTYDYEENISVEAIPSGNWQFENWSGDVSSTENPLTITMDKDYTITANFTNDPDPSPPEDFFVDMSVTDGIHTNDKLTLAAKDDSGISENFDVNDLESPPLAPPGAFFTGFINDGMNLYKDIRPTGDDIEWELRLDRDQDRSMEIEWSISNPSLDGSLKLVSDPNTPSIDIDMQTNSSYTVSDPGIQSLFIVYSAPEPSKVITDMPTMSKELEIQEKADPSMDRLKEGVRNTNEPNQLQQKNQ